MSHIHLTTFITAPAKRVFDLSRSIRLHKISAASVKGEVIGGISSGLINNEESVTWQARHLFKKRQFTSTITEMESPVSFVDEMTKGDFKSFRHQHHFKQVDNGTIMIDIVDFQSPYGILGSIVNKFFLKKYIENFLAKRNNIIKEYAESEKWNLILN